MKQRLQLTRLESVKGGMTEFYTPQSSHETMLVSIPPQTVDELFVHRFQTDQLLVVRGRFVLVSLQNRQFQYHLLRADCPTVVTIPPGIPHGAVNLDSTDCVLVNAVLRHGSPHPLDYRPIRPPFAYSIATVRQLLAQQTLEEVA